jgi:DNA-binding IclR family transcriptional regulator
LTAGEYVRNHADIYRAGREQIEDLADKTNECAHLIIEHDGRLFALYERFGQNAVGVEYHNRKREQALKHLHCTAAGKAILSQLPKSKVKSIIQEQGMPQNTDKTITDIDSLIEDLVKSRKRGYAFADEEQLSGIRAVGSPITTSETSVEGALVSGPASRMKGDKFEKRLPEYVVEAANICEVNLQTIRNQSVNEAE